MRLARLNGTMQLFMFPLNHHDDASEMTHHGSILLLLAALLFFSPAAPAAQHRPKPDAAESSKPDASQPTNPKHTVYDFSLVDRDGKVVSLSSYKGKVLLIVNLASQSTFNTQIAALNDLQKTYGPLGLQVIGIPSADFGNEELNDPAAMRKYYSDTAQVDFPVFSSAKLTGIDAIPLYQFLCDSKQSVSGGAISWSYTKFLIDRTGKPIARYEVDTDPADSGFHVDIESAISGTFKKPSAGGKKRPGGDDGNEPDSDDDSGA